MRMRSSVVVVLAVLAVLGCGGKKQAAPRAGDDGGVAIGADLGRCVATLERAATMTPVERGGAVARGCGLCGKSWDALIAADRADTGAPFDLEEIWAVVKACGGACSNQAAGAFRNQLTELGSGKPATRPWRGLASACGALMRVDAASERFASAPWYALAMIGDKLKAARSTLPAAEQARIDTALAAMLFPLPPFTAPGTGFIVPGGGLRPGTPWLHITVTSDATFVGRLAFAHLAADGLRLVDGGMPYPGTRLSALDGLAAALDAPRAAGAPPPPTLPDRIEEPVLIAPRAAPARLVLDVTRALGAHRTYLAVAAPAPAALWRGLVAAHPLPFAATAPAGTRLRVGLVTPRIAVVDATGAVIASAVLPLEDRPLVERWTAALNAVAQGRTLEIVAEDGQVDTLSALLDAAAGGAAAVAIAAPAKAALSGKELPAFSDVAIKAALGEAPAAAPPSPGL